MTTSAAPIQTRTLPWYRQERKLALAGLLVLATVVLLLDMVRLQQSYYYFGGGSMMRLSLSYRWQYAGFAMEALAYNLLFVATAGLFGLWVLSRFTRLNPPQRVLLLVVFFGAADAAIVVLRYNLYQYFKDTFSLAALKVLAGGDLRNIFNWISFNVVLKAMALLLGLMVFLFLVSRLRWPGEFQEWRTGWRTTLAVFLGWILLGVNDLQVASHEHLRFGLSKTAAYTALDSVLAVLTDFDRDGYGPLTRPSDPNNFDASIYPYAVDLPGNGVDEDGLCGDLEKLDPAVPVTGLRPLSQPNRMNVIVVVVETFRAGVYGTTRDGREVMPFLNSLGKRFAGTTLMYSNFGTTSRAIQTVFSGNLHHDAGGRFLLDHLRDYGYRTYAVSAQEESWGNTATLLGFKRLNRAYDPRSKNWSASNLTPYERSHNLLPTLDSLEVDSVISQMLDDAGEAPFAMYVNYQDTHFPYYDPVMERVFIQTPHTNSEFFTEANREAIVAQYANAAHHLDQGIAGLFAELERRGLQDKTLVVIVGDHPDSIYENGIIGHAWTLDEHQRRTPLVVVNGRGEYTVPIGQDEVADIILNTLDGRLNLPPLRFREDPQKRIFVLTGTIDTPREIGWITPKSLTSLDLRNRYYQPDERGPWLALGAIKPGDQHYPAVKELVNRWETEHYLQWKKSR